MKYLRYWKFSFWIEGFLFGELGWGKIRLVFGLFVSLLFWLLGSLLSGQEVAAAEYQTLLASLPGLAQLAVFPIRLLLGMFTWQGMRFLIAPLAAFIAALLVGARYVQDVYELPAFRLGFQYMVASLFGIFYPKMTIANGKEEIAEGKTSLLHNVGGPGFVSIKPGNVALFERLASPSSVRSAGNMQFISRFERVKEIISLEDQSGKADEKLSAVTKDGVLVKVNDVQFRYRMWANSRSGSSARRTLQNPYPYSVQAVKNMAYNRAVTKAGLTPWPDAVKSILSSAVTDYIAEHQVDQVTAPRYADGDPRGVIARNIKGKAVRDRLREIGAALVWFDIGHFDLVPGDEERMSAWEARWFGKAELLRAYGEAQRMAYQEMGRAEAQAAMLSDIVHAFDEINLSNDSASNLRSLFLARTAQLLDSMNEAYEKEQRDAPKPPLPGAPGGLTND